MNDFRDYVQHHGIKGMHWGIRRYQPYPKDYTGGGREVGEAARTQKKLVKQADRMSKGYFVGERHQEFTGQILKKDKKMQDLKNEYNNISHEIEKMSAKFPPNKTLTPKEKKRIWKII